MGYERSETNERQMPAWLVGLIIAVVVFAGFLFAFHFLGLGDTPTIEGLGG